ncbi:MAG TPA: aromatic-ring-hydroxylating dioxygenase subunit beta [Stellaceae bacterium]|nr:aromatic-ring-hydroxylating dioxygenase subunit beta [Stellaceae bacterium]
MSEAHASLLLRLEIEDLYARYSACVDSGKLDAWPDFFIEDCLYRVIPRENYERGLPLATLSFESKGMLRDRVYAATRTLFHQPYYQRHIVSGLRIVGEEGGAVRSEANYLVIRTKLSEPSEVFNTGRYLDKIVRAEGELKFAERLCVFDSELIPNSLIYPI